MTSKDYPSLWGFGTTKTFKIPVEHLDFKYIEKCSDVKHLEKILCVLRSGEEGYYPELTEFCENRLKALAPESRALRKDKPASTASSFTAEEWEKIDSDIKNWVSEITKEENKIHAYETTTFSAEGNLPPVRSSNSRLHISKEKNSKNRPAKKKMPRDYAEWDKFDVEKECSKIDDDYKEKTVVNNKSHLSKIETRIDIAGLTELEITSLAIREKEKGNEAFNSGDFEEAVMYYTRSISVLPTAVAYNNRAQAELKLQNWNSAFQDCEKVLELEPGNLKALLRRATTYKHQNKPQEALEDLRKILQVEPHNELAKSGIDVSQIGLGSNSKTTEEHFTCNSHESAEPAGAERASEPRAMGNIQKKLTGRSDGGKRSERGAPRRGRAPGASADGVNAEELSILYSNRAACCLKEGNCSDCIKDCNSSLELHPFSLKPLLRRATAYETLEQYRKAYVDYKIVLQIDYGVQIANDSINRITRILMDLDGPTWREKLSPIPTVPTSVQFRGWQPAAELSPDQVGDSCSHRQPSLTDEKRFKTLKEEGNQCVKDKNYKGALSKYSECLKINNKECAIYTNRALCYLKLCQFEEAKQDCDQALQIDDGNVKACYRRALAHKGLKNYQKSLNDLNKVLLLDSNIAEAKMELEEVTRFLNIKDNTSCHKEKERRKIEIQEVNEDHEQEPHRTLQEISKDYLASEKGDPSSEPNEYYEKLLTAKPNNAYEFGQVINAISSRKDKEACAHLLRITEPKDLPMLLSNKLEADTLLLLIQSLKSNLIDIDPSLVYQHLLHLSKAERFKMMLTLISKGPKEQIEQLFDDLSHSPSEHFTLEDVQALRRQYYC
ncbi:PREDICTED: sperm-associated antigen 1 [Condylura cristata]|uniref:sperm-associated antigen 1 n=1 Tax=Condylura cristata TaxID=143302 RepID=UPI0003344A05|nr:PREDICTED: sperm-associated antigen 1 [Condylura cristata]